MEQCQKALSRKRLEDKELHVTCGNRCYKITSERVEQKEEEEEEELRSEQEEADTRLLLHAANEQRYRHGGVGQRSGTGLGTPLLGWALPLKILNHASLGVDVPVYLHPG